MGRRARLAILGGTFDHLHAGHLRLLAAAFTCADRIGIGVTTDAYLRRHSKKRPGRIEPFVVRRRALETYLARHYPRSRWWTVPLEDPVGGALAPEVEVLVASPDTRSGANAVNRERRRKGLPRARLVFVPLGTADDLRVLSSTRIREGVVDAAGRRRRPIRLALAAGVDPAIVERIRRAAATIFPPGTPTQWVTRPAGTEQGRPRGEAARDLASAEAIRGSADYGFGVAPGRQRPRITRDPVVRVADEDGPLTPVSRSPSRTRSYSVEAQLRRQFRSRREAWVGGR